jgi:hypothetical protein
MIRVRSCASQETLKSEDGDTQVYDRNPNLAWKEAAREIGELLDPQNLQILYQKNLESFQVLCPSGFKALETVSHLNRSYVQTTMETHKQFWKSFFLGDWKDCHRQVQKNLKQTIDHSQTLVKHLGSFKYKSVQPSQKSIGSNLQKSIHPALKKLVLASLLTCASPPEAFSHDNLDKLDHQDPKITVQYLREIQNSQDLEEQIARLPVSEKNNLLKQAISSPEVDDQVLASLQGLSGYGYYERKVIQGSEVVFKWGAAPLAFLAYFNAAGLSLTLAQCAIPYLMDRYLQPGTLLSNSWTRQCAIAATTVEIASALRPAIACATAIAAQPVLETMGEYAGKAAVLTARGVMSGIQTGVTGLSKLVKGAWNWWNQEK